MLGQTTMFAANDGRLRNRVTLQIVEAKEARGMLVAYHYLHRARVGRQINYAVLIDGVVDGVITYAYPMVCAPICGVPSDELVEFARLYLHGNMKHAATCAIGKSLRRVAKDWMSMFPDAKVPRLVVSWSDREYHKGTIYKAANFRWLKISKPKARGKNRGANAKGNFSGVRVMDACHWHEKDCWVFSLGGGGAEHGERNGAQQSGPSSPNAELSDAGGEP
jgi:hypothetical protein